MTRRPIHFDCCLVAIMLLALQFCCNMQGAMGQGILQRLNTGGWRPSRSSGQSYCPQHGGMPSECYQGPGGQMICPSPQGQPLDTGDWRAPRERVPPPPERVQQRATSSTRALQPFTVRVSFEGPWINGTMEAPEGSGSMVAWDDSRTPPRWLVVTAGHVQQGDYTPYIYVQGRKLPAIVLMPNSGYDLMALEFSGMSVGSIVLPLATEYAREGEMVQYEGLVARVKPDGIVTGYGGVVGSGKLLAYRNTLMDVQGLTQGGMSGGPIYTRAGLQGVLAINHPSQGTSRGRSTSKLWDLLTAAGIHVEGMRYRLGARVQATPPVTTRPATPSERPPEIVIPVPAGPIEPNLDEYPLPDVDTSEPPAVVSSEPSDGLDELRARVKALEEKCNQEPDVTAIAAMILKALKTNTDFHKVVAKLVDCTTTPMPSSEAHLVLVRDAEGEYWKRMSEELEKAKSYFSGIREVDPPQFATPLPRLIGYEDGVPVLVVQGVRDVSDSLLAIAKGEFGFPKKEEK